MHVVGPAEYKKGQGGNMMDKHLPKVLQTETCRERNFELVKFESVIVVFVEEEQMSPGLHCLDNCYLLM